MGSLCHTHTWAPPQPPTADKSTPVSSGRSGYTKTWGFNACFLQFLTFPRLPGGKGTKEVGGVAASVHDASCCGLLLCLHVNLCCCKLSRGAWKQKCCRNWVGILWIWVFLVWTLSGNFHTTQYFKWQHRGNLTKHIFQLGSGTSSLEKSLLCHWRLPRTPSVCWGQHQSTCSCALVSCMCAACAH